MVILIDHGSVGEVDMAQLLCDHCGLPEYKHARGRCLTSANTYVATWEER
jgi:hypothetical protein